MPRRQFKNNMNIDSQEVNHLPNLASVTPTICKLMGITAPFDSDADVLDQIILDADNRQIEKIDKCLVYAPDAIGLTLYQKYRSLFDSVLRHAPVALTLNSIFPPKTPVCFASMFTGAQPKTHGILKYEKPILTCDTIFDALVRAEKTVALVAVKDSSMDLIFRDREISYFSESNDNDVFYRAIEIIESCSHDFIVVYQVDYDDMLHDKTPFCDQAIEVVERLIQTFDKLVRAIDTYWRKDNRLTVFAPDHGSHLDPQSGKGVHGDNIPADMLVKHFYGIGKKHLTS